MDYDVVMQLPPSRVVVVGAGKSGLAVARFCAARGARVIVTDKRAEVAQDGVPATVEWELGGHRAETLLGADLIVLSPGVPPLAEVEAARKRGVPITGEIELAARFIEAPIVAVTGTNGKSTVTALAGEIARRTGRPTFVGGNLGTPLITCAGTDAATARGIVVVELSSFQLETCERLRPRAATITNLTPDHLERYPDLDAYAAAKWRIAQRMDPGDTLVLNADDDLLMTGARRPALTFGVRRRGDAFVDGDALVVLGERYPIAELGLVGRHNLANALAALLLMRGSGLASYEQARAGLAAFRPLPHRMQLVGERAGVRYYDDSKATNVDAVVAGLDGFPAPFALIAGGRDKGASYAPLVAALTQNACRGVVLIGEAAEAIERAIAGAVPTARAASMEEAVRKAGALARPGDAVVLSPACSSYDMFENYEHRGRVFRAAVEALP